jgi:tetratricopeptide (TPR) repeat protein
MKNKFIFNLCLIVMVCFETFAFAQTAKELFDEGKILYEEGDYPKAIEYYEKAIKIDPNFAEAYNQLGLTYQANQAKPSEIAWYFKTATEINPSYAEAYENLGKAYYGMGDFDHAEEYCKKALEINPQLGSAQFSLAWIYLLGKAQPAEAIYHFKKVLERKKIPHAYYGLGIAYFMNEERAMVLDTITTLRGMGEDKLAVQLEDIIRGHYYIANDTGPLVDIEPQQPIEKQRSVLVPSGPGRQDAIEQEEGTTTQPIDGLQRIRFRGKLFNVDELPAGESSSKTTSATQTKTKSDITPAEKSPVTIQGTPQVISPDNARMQRIRALQRRGMDY